MNDTKQKPLKNDPRIDRKWFSRRHETSEAHSIAAQRREKRVEDKALLMTVNAAARGQRNPEQQLEMLDKRLGKGVGAIVERASLAFEVVYRKGAPEDPAALEAWKGELKNLLTKVWDAKLEVQGYRIMRRLGLEPLNSGGSVA